MIRIALIVLISCTCSTSAFAAPPVLSGNWSGYWVSDNNGHTGPLHGKFVQIDAETYRVSFHGRFAKVIPFWYSTTLHVAGSSDDMVLLTATQNLGPLFSTFQTTATATRTFFDAQFTSRSDSGRFVLTRRK